MDADKMALATRMSFLRLDRGCQAAADELWAAVKARGRPELLSAAVAERLDHPGLDGDQPLERVEELHVAANQARRAALSPTPGEDAPDHGPLHVDHALEALRSLLADLRSGRQPAPYDAGSLRLFAEELLALVEGASSAGRGGMIAVLVEPMASFPTAQTRAGDPWTCFGNSALRLQDAVTSEGPILTVAAAYAGSA